MAPHPLWIIPFALLLASIAIAPLINHHWWEKWYPAFAIVLGAIPAAYYFFFAPSADAWIHAMEDYVGFIILLASLYIVSGGIVIQISRKATPLANSVLLFIGACIANIFGTTGASMLLIRPYLRMNRGHIRPYHVVFFIFLVSNIGGLLTPIGDPPLFLGYLAGVPFWWVIEHCYWVWILAVGAVLIVFFIRDYFEYRRTARETPPAESRPITVDGLHNLFFIGLIIYAVFRPGIFEHDTIPNAFISREAIMSLAAIASLLSTPKAIYERNQFTYAPIREVAILFVGIFSAMAPALGWLSVNAARMPLQTPGQFYFTSGALSSGLDNAPTYATFLQIELSKIDQVKVDVAQHELERMASNPGSPVDASLDSEVRAAVAAAVWNHPGAVLRGAINRKQVEVCFLLANPAANNFLVAISLGAVLFGACTYIGNGPNFMVKSIAEASGVKMPHFAEYIYGYTLAILLPVYLLIWLVFL